MQLSTASSIIRQVIELRLCLAGGRAILQAITMEDRGEGALTQLLSKDGKWEDLEPTVMDNETRKNWYLTEEAIEELCKVE